jgi:microcystin degradation protein MlrC
MRIGIARIAQETSTFCPTLTDVKTLEINGIHRGSEVIEEINRTQKYTLDAHGRQSNLVGFLDIIESEDCVGIIVAHAQPSGPLTENATKVLCELFSTELEKSLPLDGLLLDIHGAFTGVKEPDVEGMILERAREILGNDVVIAVAADLHANITKLKIENVNIIRGYHTHPHIDARETAQEVAKMLLKTLRKEIDPVIVAVKLPMFTPAHNQLTEKYPMKELIEITQKQEEENCVLSSSIFSVQHLLDIPEMGWSSLVVTDSDPQIAEKLARELADAAWNQRNEYLKPVPSYKEAFKRAFNSNLKPIVIADFSDMTTGGGTGDSTWFLKELLLLNPDEPCYITMVDPQAIRIMEKKGEGNEITLMLGGKQDNKYSKPVEVTGRITRIFPTSIGAKKPMQTMMGLTGIMQIGNIYVVISEHLGEGASPNIYNEVDLDPNIAKILIAKSVVDFREGYKKIAKCFLLGEAPGLCPSNLKSLTWEKIQRPIFPLDDDITWNSCEANIYKNF